jgi:trans-aconitate methyltransferase
MIEPHGLDISSALLQEAKKRLPEARFIHANVWGWKAERTYDVVITELEYVPEQYHEFYLEGLLSEAVATEGRLIVTQYGSDLAKAVSLNEYLISLGFVTGAVAKAEWDGKIKTIACSITRNNSKL